MTITKATKEKINMDAKAKVTKRAVEEEMKKTVQMW